MSGPLFGPVFYRTESFFLYTSHLVVL